MKRRNNWNKIIFIIGTILFIIGSIDPLEGSIAILIGSGLLTLSTYLSKAINQKKFMSATLMILFGLIFMFYFSSLGGFGGDSNLSWWWSILILPYPIGWLAIVILLIILAIKKQKKSVKN